MFIITALRTVSRILHCCEIVRKFKNYKTFNDNDLCGMSSHNCVGSAKKFPRLMGGQFPSEKSCVKKMKFLYNTVPSLPICWSLARGAAKPLQRKLPKVRIR
jgi:hypothetical protein